MYSSCKDKYGANKQTNKRRRSGLEVDVDEEAQYETCEIYRVAYTDCQSFRSLPKSESVGGCVLMADGLTLKNCKVQVYTRLKGSEWKPA